uniref:Uncharacterized protein n=1 Tax=Nomascus leucogenys TaxID=61853 RepID=A0A2I3GBF2_NOMLE
MRTTQKRPAPMIQLPPTRMQPNHITLLGDSVYSECLGSEIFDLTSKGLQGFWVSLGFTQKSTGKARPGMVAQAYIPSTLGGQGGRTA